MASNPADTPTLPSSQYGSPSTHVSSSSSPGSESTVGAATAMLHDTHAPPLPVLTKVASDQWQVQVYFTGRAYPIGVFNSQLEATAAYEEAKERSGAFKEEFLDYPSSTNMKLEQTQKGVDEHIDLLRHEVFLDIKSKWDKKKRELNDSMMEAKNKSVEEAPIKSPWTERHIGIVPPCSSTPSHLSDREVQGALLSLAEKVSAEVAKERGSASHLKGTPTMQAGLEDASSKDIPDVAMSIAASPKRGAHTKRKVPEDNDPIAMKIKRARRECKVLDCSNWSVKGGVCCRHGAKKVRRLCNNEGCMKLAQIGGVCVRHRSKITKPTKNNKAIVTKAPIAPGGGGLDLLCSAVGFATKVQEGEVHVPEKNTEQVDIRGAGIVHAATAEKNVVEECYSNDVASTDLGLCSTNNGAEGKFVVEGYTNVEGEEEPVIMYPSGDDNEDDELGALVFNSSCTAKVRADIAESSSAIARHEFRHGLACNTNSLLMDSPKSDSDCPDEDVKHPTSLGMLGDSNDMVEVKTSTDNIKEPKMAAKKSSDLKEVKKRAKKSNVTNNISKPKAVIKEKGRRPFNRYNIYFIFERENLIQSKGGSTPRVAAVEKSELVKEGYDNLDLPPLPPRFAHLNIPDGWYIPRSQKRDRRPHRKTHGVATFQELAKLIAASWKTIDSVTLEWTMEVEKVLKENQSKLTRQALGIAKEAVTKKDKIDTKIKKEAVAKKKKAKNRAMKHKADRKIGKKAAQVQAVAPSVAKGSTSYGNSDFAENMIASPKNSARDDHFVHPTPSSTTFCQGMKCTDLKSPSPVTSGKGAATPDTSGNDSPSSKHAGQLKCYATMKNDGCKEEKYNAEHICLQSRAGVLPSHLEGYSQANEELQALINNLNSGHEPTSNHAGRLRDYSALRNAHEGDKSFAEHVGMQNRACVLPSASILSDWKEYSQAKGKLRELAAAHSITAPLQTNANLSREVLGHSEASLNNTVGDLEKYMYVMKCAQELQNQATKELRKRIMPHLSLLSNQTSSVAGHQYSHANRSIASTLGLGPYDSPYYNAPSAARGMTDVERIEHILQEEQARRIVERVCSASRSDGPPFMGSREERREFRG